MSDYKPYSMEWSRKRYLNEAIQKYFDDDASADDVLNDIMDILEVNISSHKSRAERLQRILDNLDRLINF